MSAGDTHPEVLHRLRVNLRRLQAHCELMGEEAKAAQIARCVSKFSHLRSLQVFQQYLSRIEAPRADSAKLQGLILNARAELHHRNSLRKVERCLWKMALTEEGSGNERLSGRLDLLRQVHLHELDNLIQTAIGKPRRKRLHALRLRIKAIRYQEEWALEKRERRSTFLKRLKDVQTTLGEFEELAEFRKLAKQLDFESRPRITKDWRRARKRARALPTHLGWILDHLSCHVDQRGAGLARHRLAV